MQFDLHRETKSSDSPAMPPPPPRGRTSSVGSISSLNQMVPFTSALSFVEKDRHRRRAGSLDERKMPTDSFGRDPTVELELRAQLPDETLELRRGEHQLPFRKRSVSCSLLPDEKSTGCDTIMEE